MADVTSLGSMRYVTLLSGAISDTTRSVPLTHLVGSFAGDAVVPASPTTPLPVSLAGAPAAVQVLGGNATALLVREPVIRGFVPLGSAGASGLAVSAAVAGAADITAADGSKFRAFFPPGTTLLRLVATSVVGVGVGSVLALSPLDVKATIES